MLRLSLVALLLAIRAYSQVAACAPCHAQIAATFQRTGMGRSFYPMQPTELPGKPYYHEPSQTYLSMITRDGKTFQRRWQLGPDAKETNVDEKQVDFVMGSGNRARTYLHLTPRGTLQQLPLSWYSEKGGYFDMNPGYDRADYPGSTRAISYECMACHNAYPRIPAANREPAAEARYLAPLPEGIDCQRCHGAGREHIAASGAAPITNPARLPSDRQLDVCMQCHLETSSQPLPHSILKHDRTPFSYVPGQPLRDFQVTFDRPPGQNTAVEVAGGAYRFRQSQCFLKSSGKLTCTTCHNPHRIEHGDTVLAAYNKVCAGCHTTAHRPTGNCVGCHMPKTRTSDAVHIVITDHRIRKGPPSADLLAEKRESTALAYQGPVIPYDPPTVDALYEATAQVRDGANWKAGLPRLAELIAQRHPPQAAFYVDLAEAYHAAGDLPKATQAFTDALAKSPTSTVIPLKLAGVLIERREWVRAEATLRSATLRFPGDPLAWGLLGWTLWQQNRAAQGQADLRKAIALDPEVPELHNYLGSLLAGTGDRNGAEREFREAVRIVPGVAEWRVALARVLASSNASEARSQFETALRLKPSDPTAHLELGRFLASSGDETEAAKHAQAAVEGAPTLAAAHELWGALLLNRQDLDGALRELTAAVRLAPEVPRSQFELGVALYSKGDTTAALTHLRLAAAAGDPNAAAFLKQLGKN